jgi:hypothetical protein
VGKLLPRLTHGKKVERETEVFQQVNLIGDEGLTNTGITFKYVTYYSLSAFSQFSSSLLSRMRRLDQWCGTIRPTNYSKKHSF